MGAYIILPAGANLDFSESRVFNRDFAADIPQTGAYRAIRIAGKVPNFIQKISVQ